MMPKQTPIVDMDDALNRALGDVAFLQMMFDEFQMMIPESMARLSTAITSGDMQRLAVDAHQFKGAAANLGALTIASAAFTLEKIGKSGNSVGLQEAFERMQDAIDLFKEYISRVNWSELGEKQTPLPNR